MEPLNPDAPLPQGSSPGSGAPRGWRPTPRQTLIGMGVLLLIGIVILVGVNLPRGTNGDGEQVNAKVDGDQEPTTKDQTKPIEPAAPKDGKTTQPEKTDNGQKDAKKPEVKKEDPEAAELKALVAKYPHLAKRDQASRPVFSGPILREFLGSPERGVAYIRLVHGVAAAKKPLASHAEEYHKDLARLLSLDQKLMAGTFDWTDGGQLRAKDPASIFLGLGRNPNDPSQEGVLGELTPAEWTASLTAFREHLKALK